MVSIFFPFRFPYPTYGIGNCKQKKLEEKIILFGTIFAAANLA
jgi:hypothetical protein